MASQNEPDIGFQLIERSPELQHAIAARGSLSLDWIAIDAERASGFRYSQRAYLIQIRFADGETWLVDPLLFDADQDARSVLADLRESLPKNWILHSATQDFPCLFELDLKPESVFDTEVAAKILGLPRVGLASLVEEFLGVSLQKEHSASDWSRRPLTDSMLRYASLDVEHLHDLMEGLTGRLIETDRLDWATQEFEHLLSFTPKPWSEDRWQKLPGIVRMRDEVNLKAAKALWLARENLAQELDVSPGRVLPDSSIMVAANGLPRSKAELARLTDFVGRYSRSKLDLWWNALQNSPLETLEPRSAKSTIPNHRSWERKYPEAHERYQIARANIQELSDELGVAPEVIISPEAVRTACFHKPESESAFMEIMRSLRVRPWQLEVAGATLAQSLAI